MFPEADGDEPVFIKLVDVVPALAGILLPLLQVLLYTLEISKVLINW